MTQKLPSARNESVAVQELDKETLIYDFEIDKAYCLNETSSIVYRHCNGKTSFDDLKRRYKYTDDLIYLALDKLHGNNLLKGEKSPHFAGLSRREAIRKVGLGTMLALPVITGLVAPRAASAASCAANTQSDPANCGSCGNVCVIPNGAAACLGGNCQIAACNAGFADCNNSPTDGCETNLNTSVNNCGGCGNVCTRPNAIAACVAGSCTVASCNAGFGNCDGSAINGCETNLFTSNLHCGACNRPCLGGTICTGGTCTAIPVP